MWGMSLVSDDSRLIIQLASEWIHLGMDLAKENSPATLERAIRCFDEAIALRRTLPLEENPFFRYGPERGLGQPRGCDGAIGRK